MTMTLESEREGFEAWVQTTSGWKACKARNKPMYLRQNAEGFWLILADDCPFVPGQKVAITAALQEKGNG